MNSTELKFATEDKCTARVRFLWRQIPCPVAVFIASVDTSNKHCYRTGYLTKSFTVTKRMGLYNCRQLQISVQ